MTQAVILAAGNGDRLQPHTAGLPKPLVAVRARPLIAHVLVALRIAGIRNATIVLGDRAAQVRHALTERIPGISLSFVHAPDYQTGNASSLWAARDAVDGPFLLAMADHLVEPALVSTLLDRARGRCLLAVDHAQPSDPRAAEATLALVENGRIRDLGKRIADWNALDTGVFWCMPSVFDAITPDLRHGEAGAVFAALAHAGQLDAVDVTGRRWLDVDTPEDLAAAEAWLAAASAGVR